MVGGLVSLGLVGDYACFGKISTGSPLREFWPPVFAAGIVGGLLQAVIGYASNDTDYGAGYAQAPEIISGNPPIYQELALRLLNEPGRQDAARSGRAHG